VDVLVGVQVGGIPADEAAEGGELADRFLRHRLGVVRGVWCYEEAAPIGVWPVQGRHGVF
jgi:hypothetical protein